ncbi:MAG TPA: rhomboid family intramembrane serine protease [Terriglobales bacterium]|nr:rhomboid family intramembrane serine protease [Terriglobales bacterium]
MRRNTDFQLGMPRFTGAVRGLILFTTAVYIVLLLLMAFQRELATVVFGLGSLSPEGIQHHFYWQFLTYGFLHQDPLNFLLWMLAIYFLGSSVEDNIGSRSFFEMYLVSIIASGVLGYLLSFSGYFAQGVALGAGAAGNAILMVFYLLSRNAPIFVFPIPIPIPTKYVVIFAAAVEGAYWLLYHFSLFFTVELLGFVAGYGWYKLLFRKSSVLGVVEDRFYGIRNAYYRWKRRRAGKKFEVYMRKYDRERYFDEHGNYREPNDKKDNGESSGPWVN